MRVANEIRRRLDAAFAPEQLELVDQSSLHAGHAGARPEGETHFRLTIVTAEFRGQSRVARQRAVFAALGDLLETDVHALSLVALTPEEAARA